MKKVLYMAFFTVASQILWAQSSLKFGPVAALNVAWFRYQGGLGSAEITPVVGYQIGGMADYELTKSIAIQPSITYSSVGAKVTSGNETTTTTPAYLNIPVLVALKKELASGSKIFANTGPYLGIGLGGRTEVGGKKSNISWGSEKENNLKRGDFGWCLGLGFEKNDFQFSVLYQLGITNISPGATDINNRVVGIRIGYLVGLQ